MTAEGSPIEDAAPEEQGAVTVDEYGVQVDGAEVKGGYSTRELAELERASMVEWSKAEGYSDKPTHLELTIVRRTVTTTPWAPVEG